MLRLLYKSSSGSRDIYPEGGLILECLNQFKLCPTHLGTGCASGVDECVRKLSDKFKIIEFKAEWDKYKNGAGPIRNSKLSKYGDALLLIWDGKSRGSASMMFEMKKRAKPIYQVILPIKPVKLGF